MQLPGIEVFRRAFAKAAELELSKLEQHINPAGFILTFNQVLTDEQVEEVNNLIDNFGYGPPDDCIVVCIGNEVSTSFAITFP